MGGTRPRSHGRAAPWWRRLDLWLAAAVSLPVVVAVVAAVAHGWTPVGDQAGEVSRIADVGTRHTPLVGPYSREGWSHPGPLLFWVCAPGWRVLGPAGVLVTVGLVNAACAVLATILARRVGGMALSVAVAAALLAVELAIGPVGLVDVWNPYVGTVALAAGLLAAAAVVSGSDRALPVAVVTLSWAVQAHVGPALTAAAAVLTTALLLGHRRRLPDRRWLVAAVVLGGLVWSGPIVDQVRGDPGNLRAIASSLAGSDARRPGTGTSLRYAAAHLGVVPAWASGDESVFRQNPAWTLAALPVALAVTGILGRRRGDQAVVAASVIVLASCLAAVAATSRVDLVIAAYLYRWTWAVGAVGWAVVAAGAWRHIVTRVGRPGPRSGTTVVAVALVVVGAVGVAVAGVGGDHDRVPVQARSAATADLLGQLEGLPRDVPYLVSFVGTEWGLVATGVAVGLMARGYDVALPPSFRHQFGAHRVAGPGERRRHLVVLSTPSVEEGPPSPGARLLATHDPLTGAERARAGELARRIRSQIDAPSDERIDAVGYGGATLISEGAEPSTVAALADLTRRGDRHTVWLAPSP